MDKLTSLQKIKWLALIKASEWDYYEAPVINNSDDIDRLYSLLEETGGVSEALDEVRCSGKETGIDCNWSRHYESKSVASKLPNGEWVGWTYWYGGGKHGNPEEIDWISDAYDVECIEEEKMMLVYTFSKPINNE
jgi:hypothetical protein